MKPKPVKEYNYTNAVHHQQWQLASAPVIRHNNNNKKERERERERQAIHV
jgi:hypothetical protein